MTRLLLHDLYGDVDTGIGVYIRVHKGRGAFLWLSMGLATGSAIHSVKQQVGMVYTDMSGRQLDSTSRFCCWSPFLYCQKKSVL